MTDVAATAPSTADQANGTSEPSTTPVPVRATQRFGQRALLWLSIVYAVGVIVATFFAARQFVRVRSIVRKAVRVEQGVLDRASVISQQLRMKLPSVLVSGNIASPFATGVLRPVIVLPQTMVTELEPDMLDIVLAHELLHIRRRDLLIGWLSRTSVVLCPE